MVRSLPYSQLLKVKKIVTTDTKDEEALQNMSHNFVERGYRRQLVNKHVDRVRHIDRQEILAGSIRPHRQLNRVPFVSTLAKQVPRLLKY